MKKSVKHPSREPFSGDKRLARFIRRIGAPEPGPEGKTLSYWREMILFALLGTGLFFSLFIIPSPIITGFQEKMPWIAIVDILVFFCAAGIFFFHGIPYKIRAAITLLLCFGIGLNIIRAVGLLSGGSAWLFTFVVLAGVLLGLRAAFAALVLNGVSLFIVGWLIHSGQWSEYVPFFASPKWALLAWVNFLFLNAVVSVPVVVLLKGLESSAKKEKIAVDIIREERNQLIEAKETLDSEIESRKKTEDALLESRENLNQILQGSPIASFVIDKDHRVIHWNRACERLTGIPKEEIVGTNNHWKPFYPNKQPLLADLILDDATDNGFINHYGGKWKKASLIPNSYELHIFHSHLGDHGIHIFVTAAKLVNRKGTPIGVVQNMQDVTEQKRFETRLTQSEKRFRDLFNSISDLVYTQDLEGRFLSVNRAMTHSFKYREDEIIGKKASDFMKTEIRPFFKSEYLEKVESKGYHNGISVYYTKDGRIIHIEYRSTLVSPPDGNAYISGSGRDVTERVLAEKKIKNLQEQMIQSRKMEAVGTLSGGIAHDFNNILGIIIGYTELALTDIPSESPTRGNLEKVKIASLRARDVVKQLLSFSRKTEQEHKPLTIGPLLKESLKLLRPSIPSNIKIECHITEGLATILADATQIQQVIINLCNNAAHAMSENGGELTIILHSITINKAQTFLHHDLKESEYINLTVKDTGQGIDPDHIGRIFDPYFTTKEVGKGTGMGLAVVHGIVKAHDGAITVDSKPGKGSSFQVFFPVVKKAPVPEEKAIEPIPLGTERILLVDDEEFLLEMESELLDRLGYQVSATTDPLHAVQLFQSNPEHFDLVITDMAMPGITGEKLTMELMKIRPDIPVILCTGFSERMTEERASALGIRKYLEKPINISQMAKAVRDIMDSGKS